MKIIKLISKIGLLLSLGSILIIGIIDFSLTDPGSYKMEGMFVDTMSTSDVIFIISMMVLVVSMFLRVLVNEKEWEGLVRFTKYFFPIAIVFYILAVKLADPGEGMFESPRYWMGITLSALYAVALMYFALKTFYQRW